MMMTKWIPVQAESYRVEIDLLYLSYLERMQVSNAAVRYLSQFQLIINPELRKCRPNFWICSSSFGTAVGWVNGGIAWPSVPF